MFAKRKRTFIVCIAALAAAAFMPTLMAGAAGGDTGAGGGMYGTFWSLVPPIIAIALALITKEVYISLFVGIVAGALFYSSFHPVNTLTSVLEMFTASVGDSWNLGILIFLVILGILVVLMNRAGGSAAYGRWAAQRIKTKRGALLSTYFLGVLIFVDDYFNCLTVGNVMSPVTDKHNISRAKLAYIIDATAAPICIIAPISSWAAAVTSYADGVDGFSMFLRTIPYNLYALLTLVMVAAMAIMGFDFGPMKKQELLAAAGDLYGGTGNEYQTGEEPEVGTRGKVIDLVLPVLVLIASCVVCMIYTGGFFEGESFIESFANSDASLGLSMGAIITLLFTFLLYIPRKVVSFKDFAATLPEGFRQMVPAILILTFAWTLSGFCRDALGAGVFVEGIVGGSAAASFILPAILFLIALGIAFATGTSWGTFGILIPIVLAVFPDVSEMAVIAISASLAGAVCGDHISPISDTTIMASTGAQCNHITHVSTQIPYVMVVGVICFVCYIITGLVQNFWLPLIVGVVLLLAVLFLLKSKYADEPAAVEKEPTAEKAE